TVENSRSPKASRASENDNSGKQPVEAATYTLDQLLRESLLLPAHNPAAALEKNPLSTVRGN
ncbi:MAG: hypothetical protein ACK6AT_10830, partial [Planctomycetota bacterium]